MLDERWVKVFQKNDAGEISFFLSQLLLVKVFGAEVKMLTSILDNTNYLLFSRCSFEIKAS